MLLSKKKNISVFENTPTLNLWSVRGPRVTLCCWRWSSGSEQERAEGPVNSMPVWITQMSEPGVMMERAHISTLQAASDLTHNSSMLYFVINKAEFYYF